MNTMEELEGSSDHMWVEKILLPLKKGTMEPFIVVSNFAQNPKLQLKIQACFL